MNDKLLWNDWHPVAAATLPAGQSVAAELLGQPLCIWRDTAGVVHAWEDRCPHRGTRLSIGRVDGDKVICAYHGWQFDSRGQCRLMPADPAFKPSANACAKTYAVTERYGLIWACLGEPAGDVLPFPEYGDEHLRKVLCGPYDVACSGPRIVENFLDMAHFAFVHHGILATQCFAWQPQTNSLAHGGSEVEYTYRVVRPLTAILTKLPQAQQDFREAISLHVQPVGEELSRVWIILAMTNFVQAEQDLRAFQDRIFLQDKPILENQIPKKLPLAPKAELHMRWDRMSVAYRRYLMERGLQYGAIRESPPSA